MLLISEYCFFFRLLFLCFRSWLPIKLFESSVELQRSGRIICFVCMFREGYIHTYFAIFLIITGTSERTHTHIYIHTYWICSIATAEIHWCCRVCYGNDCYVCVRMVCDNFVAAPKSRQWSDTLYVCMYVCLCVDVPALRWPLVSECLRFVAYSLMLSFGFVFVICKFFVVVFTWIAQIAPLLGFCAEILWIAERFHFEIPLLSFFYAPSVRL